MDSIEDRLTADIIREETRLYVDENPLAKCVHCKRADIPKTTLDHWKECENHPARVLEADNVAMAALLERTEDYQATDHCDGIDGDEPSEECYDETPCWGHRVAAILADRSKRMGEKAAGR